MTSVKLSIAEVGVLRSALSASEAPLRASLGSKLDLLHEALIAQSSPSEQSLASVAASVGLSAASEAPDIVPLTVFTGCLGAGKTTVIRSLIGQLPDGYTCAWLKNEYGDAGVDRTVAQDARVSVREIVNGCLCCTKVGELADALRALHELRPHRILVEASGSALPGPLVWEIEKAADVVRVDGVVTVVDCANFARISNFSRTAKIQAKCTDLVLLNKVELAGEFLLEQVLDDLHELVPDPPKVHTRGERALVDPAVVFGLDAALWRSGGAGETGPRAANGVDDGDGGSAATDAAAALAASEAEAEHMAVEAECYQVLAKQLPDGWCATRAQLEALMRAAPPDDLYRSKGVVPLSFAEAAAECARQGQPPPAPDAKGTNLGDTWWLFNGVAGRLTLEQLHNTVGPPSLVFMGHGLELRVADIEAALGLPAGCVRRVTAQPPAPRFGQRLIACGVARGLCAPIAA